MYGFVTLTTDYGLSDGFVAACHGVILRLAPDVRIVDVTHLVPPGEVSRGAAVLAQAVPHLPPAVHVAVVDPGVGTARRAVVLRTPGGLLVGPDNGLLVPAADALGGVLGAAELTNPEWTAGPVSATFHGRDVFSPAAARLALGADPALAGAAIDPADLVRLPDPIVAVGPGFVEAEVLTVDRFGNVQLAADAEALQRAGLAGPGGRLRVGGLHAVSGRTFGDAAPGELVIFIDSAGKVALAINGGRAVVALAAAPGEVLRVTAAS
jgi:S-adenosylmethionine hydrolase